MTQFAQMRRKAEREVCRRDRRPSRLPPEHHLTGRLNWLRAAVLGANDGVISTASLIVGVASAGTSRPSVVIAGAAGIIAGALSMGAGEFVSVSSQADLEEADLHREAAELAADPKGEEHELAAIYVARGVDHALAAEIARQMMSKDALAAHARDELGFSRWTTARPLQATFSSAASFAVGALFPFAAALLAPTTLFNATIIIVSLLILAALGAVGARAGGAPILIPALRVTSLGGAAMLLTIGLGRILGAAI